MIWSLSMRTCKQMKVRNKHWYRFCHSKPTMVFLYKCLFKNLNINHY